jgi:hypothetical protein
MRATLVADAHALLMEVNASRRSMRIGVDAMHF